MLRLTLLLSLAALAACASCNRERAVDAPQSGGAVSTAPHITVSSTAFSEGMPIPARYTADGGSTSPPLQWSGLPNGTRTVALIVDDPDTAHGTFTHWLVWNIPPATTGLPEGAGAATTEADVRGVLQGTNGAGKVGYLGPAPPTGQMHRYQFTVYALDTELALDPGAGIDAVRKALTGHVLASGMLTGVYARAGSADSP